MHTLAFNPVLFYVCPIFLGQFSELIFLIVELSVITAGIQGMIKIVFKPRIDPVVKGAEDQMGD